MNFPQESPYRTELQDAVILHCQAYRETSLFVDAFTPHYGRVRLLSKGARRGKQPLSLMLRPFNRVRLAWSGRGELPVLTSAEPMDESISLQGIALYCGFYLNELLLYLLPPQDAYTSVYQLYLETLRELQCGENPEQRLRHFELNLLEEIGYGLLLEQDAEGLPIAPDRVYSYQIDRGAVVLQMADPGGIEGGTLLALAGRRPLNTIQQQQARKLMRAVMAHYLNGRKLKSRELFKSFGAL